MPTMGKLPPGGVVSSASSAAWSGRVGASLFERGPFGVLTNFFLLGTVKFLSIQVGENDTERYQNMLLLTPKIIPILHPSLGKIIVAVKYATPTQENLHARPPG